MEQIRFEPLVAFSRAADHRRGQPGQNPSQDMFADLLGDQLKKRAVAERADLPIQRRMSEQRGNAGEHLTGRAKKPLILTHSKTLRGTAEEVEQPVQTHRSHASDRAQEVVAENPASDRAKLVVAGIAGESPDTPAEPAPDDKEQDTNATAQVPSTIQVAEEAPAAPVEGDELTVPEVLVPTESDAAPDTADMPADDETTTESQAAPSEATPSEATPSEEAPVTEVAQAAVDADMAAALLALDTGGGGTTAGTDPTNVPQQPAQTPAATAAAVAQNAIAETEAPIVQTAATPAFPAAPARPATAEPKPRAAGNSHTNPDAVKPGATPATPATPAIPAQPHLVAGAQANNASEFTGGDGSGDQALGEGNGFGQGWALHLAQGAAGKRPDFVAQLKAHLQNLPAHEQVAIHVQRALREGTNRFSIQLSPSDLGRIQVKLEIDEEKRVTAAVSVEKPSTLELLQRDARGLERALQDAGLKLDGGNLSFSLNQGGDQEWAQELERQGLGGSGAENTETQPVGEDTTASASAVLNTAAGVADLRV